MKKVARALVALGVLVAVGSLGVHAQNPQALQWKAQAIEQQRALAQAEALAAQKRALAEQILLVREQAVADRAPFDDAAFKAYWTDKLSRLPLEPLQEFLAAGAEGDLNALTAPVSHAATVSPAALGDSGSDLVFTKVEPCRIVDTRLAGGPLPAGGGRDFRVIGTLGPPDQGGTAGGCGIPYGATAVAMNLTVTGQTGAGWLRAYPYGSAAPTASVINYGPTTWALANGYIQPICDPAMTTCNFDLTVLADYAAAHVIIDVTGYFMKVDKRQYRTFSVLIPWAGPLELPPYGFGCASYFGITVDAPVAGRVVVSAQVTVQTYHTSGTFDSATVGVASTNHDCNMPQEIQVYTPSELPSAVYYSNHTIFSFFDVAPGTHTFYLNGFRSSFTGSAYFYKATMLATFQPD